MPNGPKGRGAENGRGLVTPFFGAHVLGEYVYPVYAPFGVGGGISTTKTRKHTRLLVSLTASHVVGHRPLGTGSGKDGRPRRSQLPANHWGQLPAQLARVDINANTHNGLDQIPKRT